jgi:hypothetical protein
MKQAKLLIATTFLVKNLVITISLRIFARKNSYYGDPFKETSYIDIADKH